MDINGLMFERTTFTEIEILHGGGREQIGVTVFGDSTAWPWQLPTAAYHGMALLFQDVAGIHEFLTSTDLPSALDFSRADLRIGDISAGTGQPLYAIELDNFMPVPEPTVISLVLGAVFLWLFGGCCANRRTLRI